MKEMFYSWIEGFSSEFRAFLTFIITLVLLGCFIGVIVFLCHQPTPNALFSFMGTVLGSYLAIRFVHALLDND